MKVKSESEVAQSCLTPHDPMDCSLLGSPVHEIFQAKSTGVGCQTQEILVQFLGQEDPLEEDLATHSSILA